LNIFSALQKRCCRLSFLVLFAVAGCASVSPRQVKLSVLQATPLVANSLVGDTTPVRDPSIFLENGTYYVFSTDPGDPASGQYLPIRCSSDKLNWKPCGYVFTAIPGWIQAAMPRLRNLWAPDISFFNGLYHLYYSGSTLESQSSVIGLATNTTLDPSDPSYRWVDHGEVIASRSGDDFNAIDPNILVDTDKKIWLTYGSYWSGIKQREIDPSTGMLLASNPLRYQLAARPEVPDHAIEGASLLHHGSFYYLFLSVDHCCASSISQDDYKQIVGRSSSPNGPFSDAQGKALMQGGGSILLQGNSSWIGPGGGTAYLDPQSGNSILVFHAFNMSDHADPSLWVKTIGWQNDWPVLSQ
jgi:arabinan endo-1,5-alpha-L-arabinosidase